MKYVSTEPCPYGMFPYAEDVSSRKTEGTEVCAVTSSAPHWLFRHLYDENGKVKKKDKP